MSSDDAVLVISALAIVAMLVLGAYVSNRPLTPLDLASIRLRGYGRKLAIVFTRSGYWPELIAVWVIAAATEYALRREIAFAGILALAQLLSQQTAHLLKRVFNRIRPDDWLYRHERGQSYPSGHACTAALFYGGLAVFVWHVGAPAWTATVLGLGFVMCAAGIAWARMTLAAHYATDVLGGLLYGSAWLGIVILVIRRMHGVLR